MRVGRVSNKEVVVIAADASVVEAAKLMRKRHVGDVIVVREEGIIQKPLGIITDRDIAVGIVAQGVSNPETINVADILGRSLITVPADEDVIEAARTMWSRGVRRMPVVDEDGSLVGILTFDDVIRWIAEELADLTRLMPRQQERERARRA